MIKNILLGLVSASVFIGCAATNTIVEKKDNAMITVDENQHIVKNKYQDSKYLVTKTFSSISNYFTEVKTDLYENEFVQFVTSEDTILENRKNLVIWKRDSYLNPSTIIKDYLRENKKHLDYKGLALSTKIEILNEYFFKQKQEKYIKNFQRKHKKYKFDEFKSDRENIKAINEYKFALKVSKHEWDINLEQTKKEIASDVLSTLYGTPNVKFISYDPTNEKVYLLLSSSREKFSQKISLKAQPLLAKQMKRDINKFVPKVYFKFDNSNIVLIGASVGYNKKEYLTSFENEFYKRENTLKISSETKLELNKLDIDYKVSSSNIEPPEWFYNLPKSDKTIGYGMGDSKQEAKNSALKEIAEYLEVTVSSSTSTNKKRDGDMLSSKTSQDVKIKTGDKKLEGVTTIKSQKKDNIWFVAVSY